MAFEQFVPPPQGWAPPSAGLTHSQLMGIGAVVSAWAVLEAVLQDALVALAKSPLTLGQALTEDLGPDNRLKALRRLCQTWQIIMKGRNAEQSEMLDEVAAIGVWIEKQKGLRNQVAHWQWMRQTDHLAFGFKYSTKPANPAGTATNFMTAHTTDFTDFAGEISDKAGELIELIADLRKLPPWPER